MWRVLVVEDSAAMRAMVRASLEATRDFDVAEARTGLEALRLLPRRVFDLVVTDIHMPDIHGLELIRFLRASETHARTPILIISTESSERDRQRGLALGASDFLAKPFGAERLVEAVRALLESTPEGAGT